jgi:hypothetical protein
VAGSGGCRFGDYWTLGLPLLNFAVAEFLVPMFRRF